LVDYATLIIESQSAEWKVRLAMIIYVHCISSGDRFVCPFSGRGKFQSGCHSCVPCESSDFILQTSSIRKRILAALSTNGILRQADFDQFSAGGVTGIPKRDTPADVSTMVTPGKVASCMKEADLEGPISFVFPGPGVQNPV
jgi:hypothetical protein